MRKKGQTSALRFVRFQTVSKLLKRKRGRA
nr:MAG TPA: hypothetical protein [Caudoviricetes sp.]